MALRSFYGTDYTRHTPNHTYFLPSFFSLYDTLNDDDEDIRSLSANTVGYHLSQSFEPLEAKMELLDWLREHYEDSSVFAWNVIVRMTQDNPHIYTTGTLGLVSAEKQYAKAMEFDDALFMEEDPNLFVDEVREVEIWASLFVRVVTKRVSGYRPQNHNPWMVCHAMLADWVLAGLKNLNSLLIKEDGPLGWTSNPATFAVSMRICICARALLRNEIEDFMDPKMTLSDDTLDSIKSVLQETLEELKRFTMTGLACRIHPELMSVFDVHRTLALMDRE